MAFGAPSLKGRALRYLAQREHSRVELERKLARYADDADGVPAAERIGAALDELTRVGLLSEARVAESELARHATRYGARRLRQTLQAKGLEAELVSDTVRRSRDTELERATEVWRRRYGAAPAADATGRARQMRFLAGRGFDGDVIRRVMRDAGAGAGSTPGDAAAADAASADNAWGDNAASCDGDASPSTTPVDDAV